MPPDSGLSTNTNSVAIAYRRPVGRGDEGAGDGGKEDVISSGSNFTYRFLKSSIFCLGTRNRRLVLQMLIPGRFGESKSMLFSVVSLVRFVCLRRKTPGDGVLEQRKYRLGLQRDGAEMHLMRAPADDKKGNDFDSGEIHCK